MRRRGALVRLLTLPLVVPGALVACTDDAAPPAPPTPAAAPSPEGSSPPHAAAVDVPADALDVALSEPREDSVYPHVGDPGVDALHYDLSLDWDPAARVLDGRERLVFRSTEDDETFQLDLSPALEVRSVTVDGEPASWEHDGKDLVVEHPVELDGRYELVVAYAGTPRPAAAPTTRDDFSTTGWTTTEDGETWTMQEPFGAYTWYAVNDHPSDKALYDVSISVPSPWVGVANGELRSRREQDGRTVTRWHLAEPAASYLVTVATGDLQMTEDESASGVPVTYWVPRDRPRLAEALRATARELAWLEERLGPYPYDTLGVVLVDSTSGMETQTMITLGTTDYTTSPAVLVHEMAHHWYGDQVTPSDWRDVWMNEGMAMYLQIMWQSEHDGVPLDLLVDEYAVREAQERKENGPPAAYDPATFGESNIYYGPALMWHELRERIGEDRFWSMVRAWPRSRDNGNAGREEYLPWLERRTGLELTAFLDAWLLGETTPARS